MKILFLSHTARWAGAEACLYQLLRGLDPERHEALVILPENGPLQKRLDDFGVPIHFGNVVHWIGQASTSDWSRFSDNLTRRVEALARRIERERCDLVFSNTSVVLEGALAASWVGVPHVWRIHEMLACHTNLRTTLSLDIYHRLLDTLADRVAVVSRSVRSVLRPHVRDEVIEVIENGVAPFETPRATRAELCGLDASLPCVVFVGTLSEEKGVPLLGPVMQEVVRRIPKAHCVLVGADAGAKAGLEKDARSRGLEHAFRFLGFRADAQDLIARADVLVLPSKVDSLPSAVLEAMAAGVPAVATRSGGAEELIVEGETGLLVPIGDVDGIARGLVELLSDAERRQKMGERARFRARSEFSEQSYVQGFERLFNQVVRSHRPDVSGRARELTRLLESAPGPAKLLQSLAKLNPGAPSL